MKTAKEQLASGEVIVTWTHKGKTCQKTIQVPERIFDLATHRDDWIFENHLALWQTSADLQDLSDSLFEGLLVRLRARHQPVGRAIEELKKYTPEQIQALVKAIQE
jgi:hypothetical protein